MIDSKVLENRIRKYAQSYYTGNSEISDEEFDNLIDELKEINPESEILKTPGWGYELQGSKVKHLYNMTIGSLPKVKRVEDIDDKYEPVQCRASAKLDGISVVSYYKDGKRFLSLTRGNGKEGKVVTDKIDIISPQTKILQNRNFTGAVRGEVLFSNKNWDKLKDKYDEVSNPRNIAAGIMNRDYIDEDTMYLSYVVYKVIADNSNPKFIQGDAYSFRDMEGLLLYNNFDIVPSIYTVEYNFWNENVLKEYYDRFRLEYPCDGLVITKRNIKVSENNEIVYDEFAFKFEAESKEVIVKNIDWNATRTGRIIPRVWFDPVQLSGAYVQKCTGHNAAFIRDNKIKEGTVIVIERSGEVIPNIVKVYDNELGKFRYVKKS